TASPIHDRQADETSREARQELDQQHLRRDFLIAFVVTLPVSLLEMGGHMVPALHRFIDNTVGLQASWYLQFILTSVVMFGPGLRFFRAGLPALWRLAPDMNSLVAVGTVAAYGYSVVATFLPRLLPAGTVNVYFEAAAVIVTLILLGRLLEARARGRSSQAIQQLLKLQPQVARMRMVDGTFKEVDVG